MKTETDARMTRRREDRLGKTHKQTQHTISTMIHGARSKWERSGSGSGSGRRDTAVGTVRGAKWEWQTDNCVCVYVCMCFQ